MQSWDDGCHRLVELLDGCLRRYSKLVRERPAQRTDGDRPVYLGRLWQCLGYHWRDALGLPTTDDPSPKSTATAKPKRTADQASGIVPPAANGHITAEQVAAQMLAGQGYQAGGRLAGDSDPWCSEALCWQCRPGTSSSVAIFRRLVVEFPIHRCFPPKQPPPTKPWTIEAREHGLH